MTRPVENKPDIDIELSIVYSFEKQQELLNILHSEHPDHYSRLYLVGFLKYVGYSLADICNIIDKDASWADYDIKVTWLHVRSVFRSDSSISSQVPLRGFRGEAPPRGVWGGLSDEWISKSKEQFRRNGRVSHPCSEKWIACEDCPDKCNFVFSGGGKT